MFGAGAMRSGSQRYSGVETDRNRRGSGAWLGLVGAAAIAFAMGSSAAQAAKVQVLPDGGSYTLQVTSWKEIPFRSVVRQQYDYSCGSAAVATLLKYQYNRPTTESDVFSVMWKTGDQAQIKRSGFSMLDMKRYLSSIGYQADGYRMTLDQLSTLKTPAIALIQIGPYKHFVVIKGIHDDKVLVGDPALGLLTITRPKFLSIWNGIIFAIHKTPPSTPTPIFNASNEWDPWASAPTMNSLPRWAIADLSYQLGPLYSLSPNTQHIDLRNPTAGVP